MPKGMGYGGDKKTRVTDAGQRSTPIQGSPQKGDAHLKGTRVPPRTSHIPRKNDPPRKAQDRMGLHVGTRVTGKNTRTMGGGMSGHRGGKY